MAHFRLIRRFLGRSTARGARHMVARLVVMTLLVAMIAATMPFLELAMAQGNGPEPVKVLVEDLTESTAADFARGQGRGIAVAGDGEQARLQGQGGEFVSGEIALPFAATHLGLHWIIRGGSPESVQIAVRTGHNGRTWSDWYPLTIEAVSELPDGQEVFAALAPGGRARLAQYRVTFGPAEAVALDAMTVTALNSVSPSRKPAPTPAPTPTPTPPPVPVTLYADEAETVALDVITREGWGCDETLRFTKVRRVTTEKWPEMYVPVKKIVIHHTATSNTYTDGAAEVRAIYTYHVKTLGWGDIGYNMLVDRDGKVYEGRHGRGENAYPNREILGDDVVAGHAYAYNYGTTGISAIGNSQELGFPTDPDGPMLTSLVTATTFECARQFIDPHPAAPSDFLRSDGVWHSSEPVTSTTLDNIIGHNDVNATECPGTFLKAWLPELRERVDGNLAAWAGAPILETNVAPAAVLPAGSEVTFTPESDVMFWSLEGWYKVTGEEPISYLQGYVEDPDYHAGDSGAWVQDWSSLAWSAGVEQVFGPLQPGHYTMHVRNGGYESNVTFLVTP